MRDASTVPNEESGYKNNEIAKFFLAAPEAVFAAVAVSFSRLGGI